MLNLTLPTIILITIIIEVIVLHLIIRVQTGISDVVRLPDLLLLVGCGIGVIDRAAYFLLFVVEALLVRG